MLGGGSCDQPKKNARIIITRIEKERIINDLLKKSLLKSCLKKDADLAQPITPALINVARTPATAGKRHQSPYC
jgi:hypothetical protein